MLVYTIYIVTYLADTVVVKEAQSSVMVSGVEPVTSSHTARA